MTKPILADTFISAFPRDNISRHTFIRDEDGKICTLSHQLFSLKRLIKSHPDESKFYKEIAKQIFIEKYGSVAKRGYLDRFISAIGNLFMGRGLNSSDYLLEKILCPHKEKVKEGIKSFIDLSSQEFIDLITASPLYSDEEKALLTTSMSVYYDKKEPVHKKSCVKEAITVGHLRYLSMKYPEFRIIPLFDTLHFTSQFVDNQLDAQQIAAFLPKEIGDGPSIFAHPIRVNGNHRTALILDVENGSIEFYNSFGGDSSVKGELLKLVIILSSKYDKPFIYRHVTENKQLQYNGYDCGIWTSLFVEERLKQGLSFKPSSITQDISQYRKQVYGQCFEQYFYKLVGDKRVRQEFPEAIRRECEDRLFIDNRFSFEPYYYEWCKTGVIPNELQAIVTKAIEKASQDNLQTI